MRRGSTPREARMKHLARTAALAAVLLAPTAALSAQRELPYTYQGTVHADKHGAVATLAGVGAARRAVGKHAHGAAHVSAGGLAGAVRELHPDDVLRPDCRVPATSLMLDPIDHEAGGGHAAIGL